MEKVTDRNTGQELPGVTVTVKGRPTIGTSFNAEGDYSLTAAGTVNVNLTTDSKQLN